MSASGASRCGGASRRRAKARLQRMRSRAYNATSFVDMLVVRKSPCSATRPGPRHCSGAISAATPSSTAASRCGRILGCPCRRRRRLWSMASRLGRRTILLCLASHSATLPCASRRRRSPPRRWTCPRWTTRTGIPRKYWCASSLFPPARPTPQTPRTSQRSRRRGREEGRRPRQRRSERRAASRPRRFRRRRPRGWRTTTLRWTLMTLLSFTPIGTRTIAPSADTGSVS
mmetsp:Transcript_32029/g.107839  ORF Transcript_32029/g.107839 Transcript_32029/m.107839 type:complete len:230 (+) Transcript_32029:205-894(+)